MGKLIGFKPHGKKRKKSKKNKSKKKQKKEVKDKGKGFMKAGIGLAGLAVGLELISD